MSIGVWSALKQRRVANRAEGKKLGQPAPELIPEDVERVVRRDFSAHQYDDAIDILNGYVSAPECAAIRVRVAALKLANGDLDSLRKYIASAQRDYRDVLAAAEYPEYWKATSRVCDLPISEHQRLVDADWKQYESWLRK